MALQILPSWAEMPVVLRQSLYPPPTGVQTGAYQGWAVAISGDYAVVGEPFAAIGQNGAVKVYHARTGERLFTLTKPVGTLPTGQFGRAVAISGTRVAVGESTTGSSNSRVHIFDLAGVNPLQPIATLQSPVANASDAFGTAVAMDGNRVIVGAPDQQVSGSGQRGRAYLFDLGSATPTVPARTLENISATSGQRFGYSVAISASAIAIGAPGTNTTHVYTISGGTVAATSLPVTESAAGFGCAVALSGQRLAVGAYPIFLGNNTGGRAFLYDLAGASPSVAAWTTQAPQPASGDEFGRSITFAGSKIVVGAAVTSAGRAFVFEPDSAAPTVPLRVLENPAPGFSDGFGFSIAGDQEHILAGAFQDDTRGTNTGTAYVYPIDSEVPSRELNETNPKEHERFGASVAISGSVVVVGVPAGYTEVSAGGFAYAFDLNSPVPGVPLHYFANPNSRSGDQFGSQVAIRGNIVAITAPQDRTGGAGGSGRIYLYDLASATPTTPFTSLAKRGKDEAFGASVALSDQFLVVGVPFLTSGYAAGTVYVYEMGHLVASEPIHTLENPTPAAPGDFADRFGTVVAISGMRVVVGDSADDRFGSAYVYNLGSAAPLVPLRLRKAIPEGDDAFGSAVGIDGARVIVGATGDNSTRYDAGAAYVFDLDSAAPSVPVATLRHTGASAGDQFGCAVAISGNLAVVGASADVFGGQGSGSAWVFDLAQGAEPSGAFIANPLPQYDERLGSAVAIHGDTVVVGAPLDDHVTLNKGAAFVFTAADGMTLAPVLEAPTTGSFVQNELDVDFDLPEAGAPGSVQLIFNNGAFTRSLTLSAPMASIGWHEFFLSLSSPVGANVSAGEAIPDGTYTVSVAYQDQFLAPAASSNFVTVTVDRTPPLFNPLVDVTAEAPGLAGTTVNYSAALASDLNGIAGIEYSPPSGSVFPLGTTTVSVIARDPSGNESLATFDVTVRLSAPVHEVLTTTGTPVPGAGIDPRIPDGANWHSFGAPTISDDGDVAFLGKWKASRSQGSGIFKNGVLQTAVGDSAGAGALKVLFDPTFARSSDVLLGLSTLAGTGITGKNDGAVVRLDPAATVLAREGEIQVGTGQLEIASISAYAALDETSLILVKLRGAGVNGTNNRAAFLLADGGLTQVVRTGHDILGKRVKTFRMLSPVSGSTGHGRGELTAAGVRFVATFTDSTETIVDWAAPDTYLVRATTGGKTLTAELPNAEWKTFGPAISSAEDGQQFAFLASLKPRVGEAVGAQPRAIVRVNNDGNQLVAEVDGEIPGIPDATFSALESPVLSRDGRCLAFTGKARLGTAIVPGVFAQDQQGVTRPITTLVDEPPGTPSGARWKAFLSLAAPGGGIGPVFVASLRPGKGGINASSDMGVWAVDSAGNLRCIFREGDSIGGKNLKSFRVLQANFASPGVTRDFNEKGEIVWLATLNDGSCRVIKTTVP